jgi:NAD(P)-dependent dehydrogenase (short-subunit alcohol dehydrogenase family)
VRLDGRIAAVTGAELPLVRGLALALGRAGAAIALLGDDPHALAPIVVDLEAGDARAAAIAGDWSSRDEADATLADVADALGPPDVLLHASIPAIGFERCDLTDVDDDRFAAVWEGSLLGTLFLLQAAFPHLRGRNGRVLLVTPTVSMSGAAGLVPYTAAVEAQRVLAKAAARQWGADGITLNSLAPAPEHVPIGVESATVSLAPPALDGPGDPELDLGPIAVFLASESAHFLTGATVSADGGVWLSP